MLSHIQGILFPTDFSPASDYAFTEAQEVAKHYGAFLTVLHVMESPYEYDSGNTWSNKDFPKDLEPYVDHQLAVLAKPLKDKKIPFKMETLFGDPRSEILRYAKETKQDLILMATNGRTGLQHVLIGSVAERVVRLSKCPVLVIPNGNTDRP